MIQIRFLFWNINKKNLIFPLVDLILENDIDVVALVEIKKLDITGVLNQLGIKNQEWKEHAVCPDGDIVLLSKSNISISIVCEEKHYATYKMKFEFNDILLNVVHLISSIHKEEEARSNRASTISDIMRKKEEEIFVTKEYKSIVVGDFNLQPYSNGIAGVYGFNATMSANIAKKKERKNS